MARESEGENCAVMPETAGEDKSTLILNLSVPRDVWNDVPWNPNVSPREWKYQGPLSAAVTTTTSFVLKPGSEDVTLAVSLALWLKR